MSKQTLSLTFSYIPSLKYASKLFAVLNMECIKKQSKGGITFGK